MGKKEVQKRHYSIRPFFNICDIFESISRKYSCLRVSSNSWSLRGFTLIELVVVVGVLSFITLIMISVFDPMTQFLKANDARKKADLSQIQKAIEEFYQDAGAYPTSTEEYQIIGLDGKEVPWGTTWTPYMTQLPKPPDDTTYVYYTENGQSYYLYANLKKDNDPDLCEDLDENLECPGIADLGILSESCGGPCNYGVTSPNVSP